MDTIIQVAKPTGGGRRFAIADIHGCYETFRALVEQQIQLTQQDQLFLLGDYIDRGPNSSGVLDYIMDLQGLGFQVYTLLGNHEAMLIDDNDRYNPKVLERWLRLNKTVDLWDEETRLVQKRYMDFFRQLHHCIELDDFLLVHAGFNFHEANIFTDQYAMIWARDMNIDPAKTNGRTIVHGHTPKAIQEIRARVAERSEEIFLDNGCVYKIHPHRRYEEGELGRLCALNLDTFELLEEDYIG